MPNYGYEVEMLLKRGSRFRVTSVKVVNVHAGYLRFEVEAVYE